MRFGAAVFMAALAAFAGQQSAVAQGSPDPIWREVAKVSYADVHRRPPTMALPPVDPQTAAKWRAEMANSVRGIPADTIWNNVKAGKITSPLNMAKGAGRLIGQGALFNIGMVGMNYMLETAFNRMKADANPQNSTLFNCMSNATASDFNVSTAMPCETFTDTVAVSFPRGEYPKHPEEDGQTRTWWNFQNSGQTYYFQVNLWSGYRVNAYCPPSNDSRFPGFSANMQYMDVEQAYSDYKRLCAAPTVTTQQQVDLKTYVEGGTVGSKTIAPHPEIKQELKDTFIYHIENNLPMPAAGGQVYTGVTMEPPPSQSGWYGMPQNCVDDEDGDQWADCEEIQRGSDPNDPASKPNPNNDTDKDGVSDGDEDRLGTNPYDPKSKPDLAGIVKTTSRTITNPDGSISTIKETTYADGSKLRVTVTTKTETTQNPDGTWKRTTTTTTLEEALNPDGTPKYEPKETVRTDEEELPGEPLPADDEAACTAAGGTWSGTACSKPPEDKEPDAPVANTCGDLSLPRFMKHTGAWVKDLFVPCQPLADFLTPVSNSLKTKFPFSLASSLNGWFSNVPTSAGQSSQLPASLGPVPLEWGWLSSLWATIKTLVGIALWAWFVYWLVDRFAPRTTI